MFLNLSSAAHENSTVVWRDFYTTIYSGWTSHSASRSSCVCWCSSVHTALHRGILSCRATCMRTGRRHHGAPQSALRHSRSTKFPSLQHDKLRSTSIFVRRPYAWNSLPEHLWQTTLIDLFKRSLKRFYSGRYRAQRIRDLLFNGLYKFTYLLYFTYFTNHEFTLLMICFVVCNFLESTVAVMLTRPQSSRPRPRPRPKKARPRPWPRPETTRQKPIKTKTKTKTNQDQDRGR